MISRSGDLLDKHQTESDERHNNFPNATRGLDSRPKANRILSSTEIELAWTRLDPSRREVNTFSAAGGFGLQIDRLSGEQEFSCLLLTTELHVPDITSTTRIFCSPSAPAYVSLLY
jgi:hypothetical protein